MKIVLHFFKFCQITISIFGTGTLRLFEKVSKMVFVQWGKVVFEPYANPFRYFSTLRNWLPFPLLHFWKSFDPWAGAHLDRFQLFQYFKKMFDPNYTVGSMVFWSEHSVWIRAKSALNLNLNVAPWTSPSSPAWQYCHGKRHSAEKKNDGPDLWPWARYFPPSFSGCCIKTPVQSNVGL